MIGLGSDKKGNKCYNVLKYDHFFLESFINLIHAKQKDKFRVCIIHTSISLLATLWRGGIWNFSLVFECEFKIPPLRSVMFVVNTMTPKM